MSTRFFIGHRGASDSLLPVLSDAVEKRITEHSVEQFAAGAYGRFDSLAAQAVRREWIPRLLRGVNLKRAPKNGIVESPSNDYNEASFLPEASSSDEKGDMYGNHRHRLRHHQLSFLRIPKRQSGDDPQ